jgi:hypothetical protein
VADGRRGHRVTADGSRGQFACSRPADRGRRGQDLAVALRRLPGRPPGARPQLPRPPRTAGRSRHPPPDEGAHAREPQRHDHLCA